MKKCKVDRCDRKYWAKGYCKIHYNDKVYIANKKAKQLASGELKPRKRVGRPFKEKEKCCIHDCDGTAICKKMCSKHYERVKRHGDPHVNYSAKARSNKKKKKSESLKSNDVLYTIHEESVLIDLRNNGYISQGLWG